MTEFQEGDPIVAVKGVVDWVPGGWDDVKIGQTVRLRNEDGAEAEIVVDMMSARAYPGTWVRSASCRYEAAEWELFTKATPLPTEPGLYEDAEGDVWMQDNDHDWFSLTETHRPVNGATATEPALYAPFTKLEQVPTTAKRLLDAISRASVEDVNGTYMLRAETRKALAAEFGVTD